MIYLGCHLTSAKGFENMAKESVSIGADTFQFFTRNPRGGRAKAIDKEDADRCRKLMAEHDFGKIVAHAPYTLNPASKDPKIREFAHMAMKDDLARMEYVPGNYYNFHPGSHVGQGVEKGVELISNLLNEILSPEQSTIILLETMAGKGSETGGSFEELAAVIERVRLQDKIGVCLDTCHAHDAGYDIINGLDGVLDEFDRVIGLDRLRAIHINDSKNPRGAAKDRHAKIGEGYIGKDAFGRMLIHPKLQGLPFILETPQEDIRGYGREIKMLREMMERREHQ